MASAFEKRYLAITEYEDVSSWTQAITYPLRRDFSMAEGWTEEEIIVPERDVVSRFRLAKEITGTIEYQPLSAKIFRYILGGEATTQVGTYIGKITWTPASTLKKFDTQVKIGSLISVYSACYVDSAEFRFEIGEDVVATIDCFPTTRISGTEITPTYYFKYSPMLYEKAKITIDTAEYELASFTLSIGNSLERILKLGQRLPYKIIPRRCEVTGEFTLREIDDISAILTKIEAGSKIDVVIDLVGGQKGPAGEDLPIKITLNDGVIPEYRDALAGLEMYNIACPIRFIGDAARAITVEQSGLEVFSKDTKVALLQDLIF